MRPFYTCAISALVAMVLAVGVVRKGTPTANPLIAKTPSALPGMLHSLLLFMLGKKSKKQIAPGNLSVTVEKHPVAQLKAHFDLICGKDSRSAATYLLPHCLCQGALMALLNHTHFPVALIGSVHLKSSFTVLDAETVFRLLVTDAETSSVKVTATYSGTIVSAKGQEVYVTLSLSAADGGPELWREVFVIFKRGGGKKPQAEAEAQTKEVVGGITNTSGDFFKNLPLTDGADTKRQDFKVTPNETWAFGVGFGDINPIHMVSPLAKLFGQKGRIVHGMHAVSKGLVFLDGQKKSTELGGLLPSSKTWFVSLKAPIPVGAPVHSVVQAGAAGTSVDFYVAGSSRPSICIRPSPSSSL